MKHVRGPTEPTSPGRSTTQGLYAGVRRGQKERVSCGCLSGKSAAGVVVQHQNRKTAVAAGVPAMLTAGPPARGPGVSEPMELCCQK